MTNIYLITNTVTGQQYVGKTIHDIEVRFLQHAWSGASHENNTYIDSAFGKYGKENFQICLLKVCEDSEWKYWETYYIQELKTHWSQGGYNLSLGGDSNPMDDELVRLRHKLACSSKEHREKQRIASTGRRHTDESRKKMSKVQKEIYSNPELRQVVKLHQPARVPVNMLDSEGNVVKSFDTLSDACRYMGHSSSDAGRLREMVDAFNKNGHRSKFWGYYWTAVTK